MNKNNVELEGVIQRINTDTKDGKETVSFFLKCSVPVKRGDKSFEETFHIWIKGFGKLAQEMKNLKPMDTVRLEGSFKTVAKDVETKTGMNKIYSTQINVKTIEKVTLPVEGLLENYSDDLPF